LVDEVWFPRYLELIIGTTWVSFSVECYSPLKVAIADVALDIFFPSVACTATDLDGYGGSSYPRTYYVRNDIDLDQCHCHLQLHATFGSLD
jgi:hypothetical protein